MLVEIIGHRVDIDLLTKDSIIVDVGSCRGYFLTHLYSHITLQKKNCFAIEAYPRLCDMYLRSMTWQTINAALVADNWSTDDAELDIYDFALEWCNCIQLYRDHRRMKAARKITQRVPIIRINSLLKTLNIDHIDLLKMDIEGAEDGVLRTMSQDTAKVIKQITVEAHINTSCNAINGYVKALGFSTQVFGGDNEIYGVRT